MQDTNVLEAYYIREFNVIRVTHSKNEQTMSFKVGKWDKEHPVKTRQSEFLKVFPRASLTGNGILSIKPCVIDTEMKRSDKQCAVGCYGCKKAYWLAEVKDENKN